MLWFSAKTSILSQFLQFTPIFWPPIDDTLIEFFSSYIWFTFVENDHNFNGEDHVCNIRVVMLCLVMDIDSLWNRNNRIRICAIVGW